MDEGSGAKFLAARRADQQRALRRLQEDPQLQGLHVTQAPLVDLEVCSRFFLCSVADLGPSYSMISASDSGLFICLRLTEAGASVRLLILDVSGSAPGYIQTGCLEHAWSISPSSIKSSCTQVAHDGCIRLTMLVNAYASSVYDT